MANKRAQIELIDKSTGQVIEPVDVITRSDLVYCKDGDTVDDKISDIDKRITELENPHIGPQVTVNEYQPIQEIGSGDYTVTFNFYRGNINIDRITISINDRPINVSESNINTLNITGSLSIDCVVNSDTFESNKIEATIVDLEDYEDSITENVTFVYPSYYFTIKDDINKITESMIKSSKKILTDTSYTHTINLTDKCRVCYASFYELSSIKDANGFELIDALNHDIAIISCADGINQPYHLYYTNLLAPGHVTFTYSI